MVTFLLELHKKYGIVTASYGGLFHLPPPGSSLDPVWHHRHDSQQLLDSLSPSPRPDVMAKAKRNHYNYVVYISSSPGLV